MIRLNPNENLIALYRRHYLVLLRDFIFVFLSLLVFTTAIFFIQKEVPLFQNPAYQRFLSWIEVIFYHGFLLGIFAIFADYWLDVWIVTSERIIDIEQKGLFRREVSEFKLDKIQDVNFDIKGVIPTFFDFGNVIIETAGRQRSLVFKTVPHPREIKNIILKMHDQYAAQKANEEEWLKRGTLEAETELDKDKKKD